MGGRAASVVGLTLVLCLAACARRPANQLPPPLLERAVLARSVDSGQDFEPQEPGDTFTAEAPEIFAWVRIKNISKVYSLRWLWYAPEGVLYYDSGDSIVQPTGLYHPHVTSWHRLPIAGWQAAELPGVWKVVIQLNGSELAALRFTLEPRSVKVVGGGRTTP